MVFTNTTPWKPKNLIFFFQKSSKFEFWLLTKSWNHLSFVNISPTLVIDTSMEWSSRVLQHGNQKIWFFFLKSLKLNSTCILTCAEELKSFKWVSTCTHRSTSGMHRRPFEGRHLVYLFFGRWAFILLLRVWLIICDCDWSEETQTLA